MDAYNQLSFQVEDVPLQNLILHGQQQQFINNKEFADAQIITSHWGAFSSILRLLFPWLQEFCNTSHKLFFRIPTVLYCGYILMLGLINSELAEHFWGSFKLLIKSCI